MKSVCDHINSYKMRVILAEECLNLSYLIHVVEQVCLIARWSVEMFVPSHGHNCV
jgi:hypothetical protein